MRKFLNYVKPFLWLFLFTLAMNIQIFGQKINLNKDSLSQPLTIKIMTQNVLFGGILDGETKPKPERAENLLNHFQKSGADLFALTESYSMVTNEYWAEKLGYNVVYTGDDTKTQESWLKIGEFFAPTSIITSYEIIEREYFHFARSGIMAKLQVTPDQIVMIGLVHLWGKPDEQITDLTEMLAALEPFKGIYPIIVTGDFNAHSALDGPTEKDVDLMQLAYYWGLKDGYRVMHPDYQKDPGHTIKQKRIDFILYLPDLLTPTFCDLTNDKTVPGGSKVSDHIGVLCNFQIKR